MFELLQYCNMSELYLQYSGVVQVFQYHVHRDTMALDTSDALFPVYHKYCRLWLSFNCSFSVFYYCSISVFMIL